MRSCIYRGSVEHCRLTPVKHRFRYSVSWLFVDLDEWPSLVQSRRLLSESRFGPISVRRSDHFGADQDSLSDSIRRLVHSETGYQPEGPIRLLTQARQFGIYFSPLNMYYCFTSQGDDVEAVVAEVSNTPWNERHYYVLEPSRTSSSEPYGYQHPKEFHVSPFMDMESDYRWQIALPTEELGLAMACHRDDREIFRVGMRLTRCELSDWQLFRMLLRYPVAPMQILSAIYYQALRLWIKRCPFYPHPKKQLSNPSPYATRAGG